MARLEFLRRVLPRLRPAAPAQIAIGLCGIRSAAAASEPASEPAAQALPADALAAALARTTQQARVRIEVDAAWARMFLLPWTPALSSARRWEQFAASRFAQRYECAAQDWVLRVLAARPPHARLVVALPKTLVDACTRACGRRLAGLDIGVLRWLAAAAQAQAGWNGCRIEIDDLQTWLFVFERGVLVRVRARRERDAHTLRAAVRTEWAAHFGPGAGPAPERACVLQWGPRARAAGLERAYAAPAAMPAAAQAA